MGGYATNLRGRPAALLGLLLLPLMSACAAVPLEPAGTLSSYQGLTPSNGVLTRALVSVSKDEILAAKTVRIVPTTLTAAARQTRLSDEQRTLIANAVDRFLCAGLSDRFEIVPLAHPADLTVRASIARIIPTDETAAVASKLISIGASVATATGVVTVPVPVPIPTPRLPLGLGGLAIEAEALDRAGTQKAAMMWARGADSFTSKPRVSAAGDAYDLAASFSDDFSKLLITGASPFGTLPRIPPPERVWFLLGGPPKEPVCAAFGRSTGVAGLAGVVIGLPPEWTDKGARQGAAAEVVATK